jgi:hypothetical protein
MDYKSIEIIDSNIVIKHYVELVAKLQHEILLRDLTIINYRKLLENKEEGDK